MSEATASQTKTIHEYLAENPDHDVTDVHQQLYGILGDLKDRVLAEMPDLQPQEASKGLDYWQTESGYEGSMQTWTGQHAEHVAHSFIGNRKASILDMNLQVWLGPHIDVPHLVLVFGTIPQLFYYSELVPRRDLMTDLDYLNKYYGEDNADYLELRGDPRFTWSVSHGTYMRAYLSPSAHSYTTDRTPEMIEVLRDHVNRRFDRWMRWVDEAQEVPEDQRRELQDRDWLIREYGYTQDPMNKISENFLGADRTQQLLEVRYGKGQIDAAKAARG
jgi:hypothetical protein